MKVDGRSLRKMNGSYNPNAYHTWKQVDKIKRLIKTVKGRGRVSKIARIMNTNRFIIWKIGSGRSYLKRPPKKENINHLISQWTI